jgi:hypothetical protein
MNDRLSHNAHPEDGATLILALIFVVLVGAIVAALLSLAGTNLLSTTNLQHQRNHEFAADAAVDGAIQSLRHQAPTSPVTCPNFPSGVGQSVTINGDSFVVECSMAILPNSFGRLVEFDACPLGLSFSSCAAQAVVRANVTYDDLSSLSCQNTSQPGCTYGNSWGTGLNVWSWVVQSANS